MTLLLECLGLKQLHQLTITWVNMHKWRVFIFLGKCCQLIIIITAAIIIGNYMDEYGKFFIFYGKCCQLVIIITVVATQLIELLTLLECLV